MAESDGNKGYCDIDNVNKGITLLLMRKWGNGNINACHWWFETD